MNDTNTSPVGSWPVPVYLDCNATTPIEPRIHEAMCAFAALEIGNAGSRTHEFGVRAKRAAQTAREQVAAVANAKPDEIVFTSGATESNNLAILGLSRHGEETGRRHLVTTAIEHKAVLEPLAELELRGFEVTRIRPTPGGWVDPDEVLASVREDTLLVSVMHVNNETGVIQPVREIADRLGERPAYFHVDAAQGFGKLLPDLQHSRIDLISVSAHKMYGPKGIGALVTRRRGYSRPPLRPLMLGGGQERGLRPGTLPVPLLVGFGLASEMALNDNADRRHRCLAFRERMLKELEPLGVLVNGEPDRTISNAISLSVPGLDSEAAILALKEQVAISNGSACTSQNYELSHVLLAMGLTEERVRGAIRLSWCHLTEVPDWPLVARALRAIT